MKIYYTRAAAEAAIEELSLKLKELLKTQEIGYEDWSFKIPVVPERVRATRGDFISVRFYPTTEENHPGIAEPVPGFSVVDCAKWLLEFKRAQTARLLSMSQQKARQDLVDTAKGLLPEIPGYTLSITQGDERVVTFSLQARLTPEQIHELVSLLPLPDRSSSSDS